MNTLITVIPKLAPIVYEIIEKDGNHEYGLKYNVDYGVIRTTHFKAFDYIDDVIVVERVDDERSHWWLKAFEPGKGYWDGTSLMPDKGKIAFLDFNALFKASVFHDVIYKKAEAISKATGIPVSKIFAFADDMLKILAEGYGADKKMTTPIHWLVRTGGNLYHKVKKIIGIFVVVALCGCYSIETSMEDPPPEVVWTGPFFDIATNAAAIVQNSIGGTPVESVSKTNIVVSPQAPVVQNEPQTTPAQSVKIESFGSPNCSKASEDLNTQIKDLKMSKNGLSYKWSKGSLANWGISDKHDASALAVAGYGDGKTFKCAKFDWISTDRLTRSFENIYGHYNGFDPDKFFSAKHRCFFIMSKDGKRRTNVLVD